MTTKKKKSKQVALSVGDQVQLLRKEKGKFVCGTIKYIGNIYRKKGIWYGIELDKAIKTGKTSNGQHQSIQYFKCDNNKAMFVKYSQINIEVLLKKKPKKKSQSLLLSLRIGQKVSIKSVECNGIIKYIGEHQLDTTSSKKKKKSTKNKKQKTKYITYYGIELEKSVGNNNGKFDKNKVQYFECGKNYGIFVTIKDIGKPYIDYDRNELLLSGFIKNDEHQMNDMIINIPMDIIVLCIKFYIIDYKLYNHILTWYVKEENERKYPDYLNSYDAVEFIDVSNASSLVKKHSFKFDVRDSIESSVWSRYGVYYNLNDGLSEYMKKYMKEKGNIDVNINSVLIRNGGYDNNRGRTQTDCWFFDSNDIYIDSNESIHGYFYNLPAINQRNNADIISKHSFFFDNINNMMYTIGGVGYDDDDNRWYGHGGIWKLNLNQINDEKKFKWNRLGCSFSKNTPHYAATEILDYKTRKYLICGGCDKFECNKIKQCHQLYYDTESKQHKLMELAKMKYKRSKHVICRNKIRNMIFVGSGGIDGNMDDITNRICEMYDVEKNKWFALKVKTNFSYWTNKTCIWTDHLNNNLLYIAGNENGTDIKHMEFIDLRIQKNGWIMQSIHYNHWKQDGNTYKMQWMMT